MDFVFVEEPYAPGPIPEYLARRAMKNRSFHRSISRPIMADTHPLGGRSSGPRRAHPDPVGKTGSPPARLGGPDPPRGSARIRGRPAGRDRPHSHGVTAPTCRRRFPVLTRLGRLTFAPTGPLFRPCFDHHEPRHTVFSPGIVGLGRRSNERVAPPHFTPRRSHP